MARGTPHTRLSGLEGVSEKAQTPVVVLISCVPSLSFRVLVHSKRMTCAYLVGAQPVSVEIKLTQQIEYSGGSGEQTGDPWTGFLPHSIF